MAYKLIGVKFLLLTTIGYEYDFKHSAICPDSVDFDKMWMKYNVVMALAKLTNMCNNLNLGQGGVYKSKYYKQNSAAELSYKIRFQNSATSPELIDFLKYNVATALAKLTNMSNI